MIGKLKKWMDKFPLENELICLGIGLGIGVLLTCIAFWVF